MAKKKTKIATTKDLKAGAVCKDDNVQASVWGFNGQSQVRDRYGLRRPLDRLQVVINFTSAAKPRYTAADTIQDGLRAVGVVTFGLSVKDQQSALLCDLLAIEKLHEAAYQFEVDGWKEEDQKASHALRVRMNLATPRLPAKSTQLEVAKAEGDTKLRMDAACIEILAAIGANPFGSIGESKRDQGGKATRTFVTDTDLTNIRFCSMDADALALLEADAPAKLVLASGAVVELTLAPPKVKKEKNARKTDKENARKIATALTLAALEAAIG